MAIAKGKETQDVEFKRFIGVASCYIKGVNPTKKELEEIYGNTVEEEPSYVGEVEVKDGENTVKCKNVRINILALPDSDITDKPISVTMFIQKRFRYNKDCLLYTSPSPRDI